jgi:integrase
MKRLTDSAVQAAIRRAEVGTGTQELSDPAVPGLTLRVGRRVAAWSLMVRVAGEGGVTKRGLKKKGERTRISLGEYPTVSLEAARASANTFLEQASRGVSPAKALEAAATAGGLTVRALGEKFLTDYVCMKELRSLTKYEGALSVHVYPRIGEKLADLLTREMMREMLKAILIKQPRGPGRRDRPRGGKEAARTVLTVVRKMLNWGMREKLIKPQDNPMSGMEDNLPKKRRKETVLSLDEARIAWRAAGTLGYPFGPIYRLILLTGCRPSECAECLPAYVDLKQTLLVLPADAYKTDHVHVLPLVPEAVSILDQVLTQHRGPRGDYLFSGTDGERPVSGWNKAQARMLRAYCAESGERPRIRWTPQDLRRTVATRIAEQLGIAGEQFIKRVLGHSDGSVTAIYNRYGYVKEMRAVLTQWVKELTADEGRPSSVAQISIAA